MPADPKSQSFYRWVDAQGTVHVVSSLDAVPAAERARMEEVSLQGRASPPGVSSGFVPEWGSVALGFGAGVLLVLVLPHRWKWVTRFAAVLATGALLSGAYLALVRRSTGADDGSLLATPSAIIEDARAAVEKANAAQRQREQELEAIRKEGR